MELLGVVSFCLSGQGDMREKMCRVFTGVVWVVQVNVKALKTSCSKFCMDSMNEKYFRFCLHIFPCLP